MPLSATAINSTLKRWGGPSYAPWRLRGLLAHLARLVEDSAYPGVAG